MSFHSMMVLSVSRPFLRLSTYFCEVTRQIESGPVRLFVDEGHQSSGSWLANGGPWRSPSLLSTGQAARPGHGAADPTTRQRSTPHGTATRPIDAYTIQVRGIAVLQERTTLCVGAHIETSAGLTVRPRVLSMYLPRSYSVSANSGLNAWPTYMSAHT